MKRLLLSIATLAVLGLILGGCAGADNNVTFSQLISQTDRYNGKAVTLDAFYFSGWEISALPESVGPSSSGTWRIVPVGTMVWVAGGIAQELQNSLLGQTDPMSGTPSGWGS